MMPTDALPRQVTPDSVEPTSLSCSLPPLEWPNLWTTIGSVATSIFTRRAAYLCWWQAEATKSYVSGRMVS